MKNKNLILYIVVIVLVFVLVLIYSLKNKVDNTIDISKNNIPEYWNSTSTLLSSSTTTNTEYYNAYHKIKFTIPTGWSVSKDYMDENSYKLGQFQLFNYIMNGDSKGLTKGQNKIEGMIVPDQNQKGGTSTASEDSIYTPKSKKEEIVEISGYKVKSKTEIFYGGMTIKTYMLPVYKETNSYLSLSIYGDISNFNTLDILSRQILENYKR